jgi:drug/metabolite transporter (DMT)-like permease
MSDSTKPRWWWIAAALLTLYIVWGSTYLAIRVGVETIPPFLMGALRFLIAGVLVLGFIAMRGGWRVTRKQCRDNAIGGFFMLLGGNGLVSWAEETVPSGMATLVISLNPVFFVLAEWVIASIQSRRGEAEPLGALLPGAADRGVEHRVVEQRGARPNVWTLLGLAVGFLGLVILVGPGVSSQESEPLDPWRVLALVMACVNWTIGSMYVRYASHPAEPFTGAGLQMLFGAMWMFAVSWILGEWTAFGWDRVSAASWWSLLYLIVAGSLIGYTSFVWLMKHASPTLVSTYGYINPVVAVFLGWWILGETVGPRILLASLTIIAGVAMISMAKHRSGKPQPVIAPTEDTEVDMEHLDSQSERSAQSQSSAR